MRRKSNNIKYIIILVLLGIISFGVYKILTSSMFEKNTPKINLAQKIFWNGKDKINLAISDDSGIKSVKIFLVNENKNEQIFAQNFTIYEKMLNFELELPKELALKKADNHLLFEITDISKANFFMGNTATFDTKLEIDNKKPEINVINQSYKITKGGSGVVVFRAFDEGLKEVYIKTNSGKIFTPTPFYKPNYYASLVAWDIKQDHFEADIIATDLAGNERKTRIKYYLQDKKYKTSNISLKDDFIDGKITELYEIYNPNGTDSGVAKFKYINENLRGENEKFIADITSKVNDELIKDFKIIPFYPLKNGAAVASYGDHRFYEYGGESVSESWHLGLDLASVANAEIIATGDSKVAAIKDNGIYGLNVILDHGFGLYSLYGHCFSTDLNVGDEVKKGDIIALTGASGLAFGDHLHFGTVVQGVEVRPEEWMDKKWLKDNIFDVMDNAKKVIENSKN